MVDSMNKDIGYTFAIATRNPKQTFVFCKWFTTVEQAIDYAKGEIKDRSQYDVEFILIREGVTNADDPIIWDSRKDLKPEPSVKNGAVFIRLLRQFEKAAVAQSWIGGQAPEDHAQIKQDYIKAKATLMNHVCNNIKD